MARGKAASLVVLAFLIGFALGTAVGGRRHQTPKAIETPEVAPVPSQADLRAVFVRQEAQRMDDESQGRTRVEMRGLTNEYVLILCPWHSAADLAEYTDLLRGEAFKEVAIDAPKKIGTIAVEEQMKKESLKRLGFIAVLATADRKNYWNYDVASDSWTLQRNGQVPW